MTYIKNVPVPSEQSKRVLQNMPAEINKIRSKSRAQCTQSADEIWRRVRRSAK